MEYHVFDLPSLLWAIKEKLQDSYKLEDKEQLAYLKRIPEETPLSKLPFYKDYVSKFKLPKTLRDKKILTMDISKMSQDDCLLLLKLVAASWSSEYEIDYNAEQDALQLTIIVKARGVECRKTLQELWHHQEEDMFLIYLDEQLTIDRTREEYPIDVDEDRRLSLALFNEKVKAIIASIPAVPKHEPARR